MCSLTKEQMFPQKQNTGPYTRSKSLPQISWTVEATGPEEGSSTGSQSLCQGLGVENVRPYWRFGILTFSSLESFNLFQNLPEFQLHSCAVKTAV